eukprot:127000_1
MASKQRKSLKSGLLIPNKILLPCQHSNKPDGSSISRVIEKLNGLRRYSDSSTSTYIRQTSAPNLIQSETESSNSFDPVSYVSSSHVDDSDFSFDSSHSNSNSFPELPLPLPVLSIVPDIAHSTPSLPPTDHNETSYTDTTTTETMCSFDCDVDEVWRVFHEINGNAHGKQINEAMKSVHHPLVYHKPAYHRQIPHIVDIDTKNKSIKASYQGHVPYTYYTKHKRGNPFAP